MNNNKWFQSSDGSGNLSTTLQGILVLAIPSIITIAQHYGFHWGEDDVMLLVNNSAYVIGLLVTIVGLLKKLWYARQ